MLVFHQVALTVIHYGIGPAMGFDPRGAWLVSGTIVVVAILVLLIIGMDVRTPGRSHAILLTQPRWNVRTFGTMLVGLAMMCSEAVWWRCHRRIITDYLLLNGHAVDHLMGPGQTQQAIPTPGAERTELGKVIYP